MRELLRSLRVLLPIRSPARFLTAVLGPICRERHPDGTRCTERIYPRDRNRHHIQHLGADVQDDGGAA